MAHRRRPRASTTCSTTTSRNGRSSASSTARAAGRCSCTGWRSSSLVLSYLVCRGIVKSRVGRSLIAIRDNETAAAVMGVNRARDEDARVRPLGGDDAPSPGRCSASAATWSTPTSACFTLVGSITFVVVMVLGGGATLWGPIVGAHRLRVPSRTAPASGAPTATGVGRHVAFGWLTSSPATFILAVAAAAADVRRPVRHRRPAQAPRRQGVP